MLRRQLELRKFTRTRWNLLQFKNISTCIVGTGPSGCYTAKYLLKEVAKDFFFKYTKKKTCWLSVKNGSVFEYPPLFSVEKFLCSMKETKFLTCAKFFSFPEKVKFTAFLHVVDLVKIGKLLFSSAT